MTDETDRAVLGIAQMAGLIERIKAELDQQFRMFSRLRDQAERLLAGDGDEAEQKLLRADLKAAVDALSVIVRTLEKVDEIERRLMRDRAEMAAEPKSEADYAALLANIEAHIEARVAERLAAAGSGPLDTGPMPGQETGREPGPDKGPDKGPGQETKPERGPETGPEQETGQETKRERGPENRPNKEAGQETMPEPGPGLDLAGVACGQADGVALDGGAHG